MDKANDKLRMPSLAEIWYVKSLTTMKIMLQEFYYYQCVPYNGNGLQNKTFSQLVTNRKHLTFAMMSR